MRIPTFAVILFVQAGLCALVGTAQPASPLGHQVWSGSAKQDEDSGSSGVVGKMAIVRVDTQIHSRADGSSRVLVNVPKGTYLAITKSGDRWSGLLMPDRSSGWVRTADIQMLSYDVLSTAGPGSSSTKGLQSRWARRAILAEANKLLGVPYRRHGASLKGLDSANLVRHCFGVIGIVMPKTLREQMATGTPVKTRDLQMGDRLYFANRSGRLVDTGIYMGNGYFVHSSRRRGGVCVSRLDEPIYARMFCAARR